MLYIFIDFSKAFDEVDHTSFFKKTTSDLYGIIATISNDLKASNQTGNNL